MTVDGVSVVGAKLTEGTNPRGDGVHDYGIAGHAYARSDFGAGNIYIGAFPACASGKHYLNGAGYF